MRIHQFVAGYALAGVLLLSSGIQAQSPAWTWYEVDANRNVHINLYLFWSQTCPHCPPALQFADYLRQRYPWLNVYTYETSTNPANQMFYQQMAASLHRAAGQTPAFFYGKDLTVGYISYDQTGRRIEQRLVRWYEALRDYYRKYPPSPSHVLALAGMITLFSNPGEPPPPPDLPVELPPEEEKVYFPGWGEVGAADVSLPLFTLVIAGCDSVNPCAFFVLLLLLSLLIHGRSRARMLIVGGVFVFFSGLWYFLFMAAWLNLFFVIGHLAAITVTAGVLAVVIGLLNVKDFFWFKKGPSLSIPDSARPGLFRRMARLIDASSLLSLMGGAVVLAATSNLYELLCTSGFPMVYTRVLTLRELSPAGYYGYLILYNVIYVAPMALIVLAFVLTLGAWKMTEHTGRILKLLSGIMMLALGVILVFRPETFQSVKGAVTVLAASGGLTAAIVVVSRWWKHRHLIGKRGKPSKEGAAAGMGAR